MSYIKNMLHENNTLHWFAAIYSVQVILKWDLHWQFVLWLSKQNRHLKCPFKDYEEYSVRGLFWLVDQTFKVMWLVDKKII